MPGGDPTTWLIRHAKAGSRERWTAPDRERPLSEAGRIQAAALVARIGPGVRRIKSSPYKRCIETVQPLAEALGLRVEEEIRLAEGAGPEWTLAELATAGGSVLCTHGDVMAEVVTHLADLKVPLQGGMQWAKAGTWAFDIAGGRIVAGRYLPPPI
jgi:phosphohistidine phosphatase SixA